MNTELKDAIFEKMLGVYRSVIALDISPTKSSIHTAELVVAELSALLGKASYEEFQRETESLKDGLGQLQKDLNHVAD